jgi:methionyl-tRNA formyltransferase
MKKKILFIHKKNCTYSIKLIKFLKTKNFFLRTSSSDIYSKILKISKGYKFDYIVLFRSHVILKKDILHQSDLSAINFHPSTPNYRGIGGVNFAIYNNEKYFGTTAHYINEKIDNGKIINVKKFKIDKKKNVKQLYSQTLNEMYNQAKFIFSNLDNLGILCNNSKNEKWFKKLYNKKDLEKLYKLKSSNIKKEKLKKIIKATSNNNFKPYIDLYGHKFRLDDE